MTVLRERVTWTKPRPTDRPRRSSDLSPDEQVAVRRALRFLAVRLGGWAKLAEVMRAKSGTVQNVARGCTVSAGLALRAARAAEVEVEALLSGRWPQEGACPHCGRHG